MKKQLIILICALVIIGCTHTSVLTKNDTKYTLKAIPQANTDIYYDKGVEYTTIIGQNAGVQMTLSDMGETFWLQTLVAAESKGFTITPREDITVYVLKDDGTKNKLKQYSPEELQKDLKKEADSYASKQRFGNKMGGMAAGLQNIGPSNYSTGTMHTTYQDSYGRDIGYANTTYTNPAADRQNRINAQAVANELRRSEKNNTETNIAYKNASTYQFASIVDSAVWKPQTIVPEQPLNKTAFFQSKSGKKYLVEIRLGQEVFTIEYERIKK